jgi:hypothetical protein
VAAVHRMPQRSYYDEPDSAIEQPPSVKLS